MPDDAQPIRTTEPAAKGRTGRDDGADDLDAERASVGGLVVELVHGGGGARGGLERDADGDAGVGGRGEDRPGAGDGPAPFEDGTDVVWRRTAHEPAHLDDVTARGACTAVLGRARAFDRERFICRGSCGGGSGGRSACGLAQGAHGDRRGDVGTRWARRIRSGREPFGERDVRVLLGAVILEQIVGPGRVDVAFGPVSAVLWSSRGVQRTGPTGGMHARRGRTRRGAFLSGRDPSPRAVCSCARGERP